MTPSWLKSRMIGKHKQTPPKPIPDPLATAQQTVAPSNGDENHSIGLTVASKLRKMYHDQRLFAENLINQALFKGMMFQLSRQSEIKTPPQKPSSPENSGLNVSPVTCIEIYSSQSSQSSPPLPVRENHINKEEGIAQLQCDESKVTPCEILPHVVKPCEILPCVVKPCETLPHDEQSFEILEPPCQIMASRHTLPSLPPISHLVMDNQLLDSGSMSPDDSNDYKELTIL